MERLTKEQSRMIVGGKGTSGAFLNGCASIIDSISDLFVNGIGSISNVVFTAKSLGKVDKIESKIGDTTLKIDNSVSNKKTIESENPESNFNVISLF